MNNALRMTAAVLLASAACLPSVATAQRDANAVAPGPEDSRAPVPALVYQSPFAGYRPFPESVLGSWKAVNDEVGRIGGWKVYAREVYEETKRASPESPERPPDAQRVK